MNTRGRQAVHRTTIVLVVGGVLTIAVAVLVLNLQAPPDRRAPLPTRPAPANPNSATPEVGPAPAPPQPREPKPEPPSAAAPPPVTSAVEGITTVTQADLDYLATRNLLV